MGHPIVLLITLAAATIGIAGASFHNDYTIDWGLQKTALSGNGCGLMVSLVQHAAPVNCYEYTWFDYIICGVC
jgi:hypothetical protein